MYLSTTLPDTIIDTIQSINVKEDEVLLLLFGEESEIDYPELIAKINALNISFFGGIFPGVIYGKNSYKSGCIIKKFPAGSKPIVIKGLENSDFKLPLELHSAIHENPNKTIFTLVDGLTGNIATYLKKLFKNFGNSCNFLGGGAGSLSLQQQPCVFTNEGIFQDAAVLCPLQMEVSIGVQHGWNKLKGPIVATHTEKNIIHELNWKNAFDVYRDTIEESSNLIVNHENFFDIAKSFPFGIIRESGEDIVRDPIAVDENGSLICVGEVPENTVLYILQGQNEALIESAQVAIKESISDIKNDIQHTLIVDCISRTLFLESEFSKELEAICNATTSDTEESIPQGILSLGEISSNDDGYIEFYNKTLVVGSLTNVEV